MSHPTAAVTPWPVQIRAGGDTLHGDLSIPEVSNGLVIFAHSSGSGRHGVRNRSVAETLQHSRIATLLMDLLTESEERTDVVTSEFRFNIPFLTTLRRGRDRLGASHPPTARLPIGVFGASTGARRPVDRRGYASSGGARRRVARRSSRSCRGRARGRDSADSFIVGGLDDVVIDLNKQALARLSAPKQLVIVPGATHLFEEPGTLAQVAQLATEWFGRHLAAQEDDGSS